MDIGNCQIPVDDEPVVRTVPASDFSLVLSGYQGYSTYQVTVIGVNVAGEGEPTTATFLTPPIGEAFYSHCMNFCIKPFIG